MWLKCLNLKESERKIKITGNYIETTEKNIYDKSML